MEKLIRRKFSLVLVMGRKWLPRKELRFFYEEVSAMEAIEFIAESSSENFDPMEWLFGFLSSHWKLSRSEYSRMENPEEVFAKVRDSRFRDVFSGKKEESGRPFESFACLLAEKFHLDPLSILSKYTFSQLAYLTAWIVWNANEQTEEGRKRNAEEAEKKRIRTPEYRDATAAMLAKLKGNG